MYNQTNATRWSTDYEIIQNPPTLNALQSGQAAYINNKFQGAMTWALLDTLKKNNNLTWKELIVNMRNTLKRSKFTQVPQLSSGRQLDLNSKFKL